MPYSEAQYETPPYISILESRGVQGDSILVEGIHTGSAKVSAKVADLAYKVGIVYRNGKVLGVDRRGGGGFKCFRGLYRF